MISHSSSLLRIRPTILLLRPSSSPHRSHHAVRLDLRPISAVHLPAHYMLDEIPQQNSASFDSIIAAHCRAGHVDEACALVSWMMAYDLRPTRFTFVPILSSRSLDLHRGAQLHTLLLKTGLLHSDPFSSTALMGHHAKNWRMDDALKLFDEMPLRTVVTWNCIISGFSQLGCVQDSFFLFRELLRAEVGVSESSFVSVLSGFRASECSFLLEQMHGLVIKSSMDSFAVVANALLGAYSNCFLESEVDRLFNDLPAKDIVSWNTIISAFARGATPERALESFFEMLVAGVLPNENTLASVLVACTGVDSPKYGELVHAKAIKQNLSSSVYVGSSLIDFYAKCKRLEDAHVVFSEIPEKNVVTWNSLISGYSNINSNVLPVLFKEMLRSGFRPNEFTFSCVLRKVAALDLQQLHSLVIKMGCQYHDYVSSALIASYDTHDMISDALACSSASVHPVNVAPCNAVASIYNRIGRYEDTKEMLLHLQHPDTISWNILVAACARNGDYSEALRLFRRMQTAGCLLDNYMAVSLLSICSKSNTLALGSIFHGLIIKTNAGSSEVFVSNVLMDMYAKCGSLEGCVKVFQEMGERNLISWTALISGLGLHGCTYEALERFMQMESEGWKPDGVAFLAALSACRHSGSVQQGMLLFERMKSVYEIEPEMDHYIVLVDLLSRHGYLKEAEQVICGMPFQQNAVVWRIFLQGCKMYG